MLEQNYSNPFNPSTVVGYQLPVAGWVTLKVYDGLGQELETLVNETQDAGYKSVRWDASEKASGIYFYRLIVGTESTGRRNIGTKKMVLIR